MNRNGDVAVARRSIFSAVIAVGSRFSVAHRFDVLGSERMLVASTVAASSTIAMALV
jgi:hypothetical protein